MNIINTDIVVIGCGAAGMRAAVSASARGCSVVALNKSPQSCTLWADKTYEISGGGGCGFAAPVLPPDTPDAYLEDLTRMAAGKNVHALTAIFAEKSSNAFHYLWTSGVRFKTGPQGDPLAVPEIWHSHPRLFLSEYGTGKEIIRVLRNQALSHGVKIINNAQVFKLLTRDGEIAGCLAFSGSSSDILCIRCKGIVLASGGAGGLFQFTSNPEHIQGDGIPLAEEVGAQFINMDKYADIPMSLSPISGVGFVPRVLFAGLNVRLEDIRKAKNLRWQLNPEKLSLQQFEREFPKTYGRLATAKFSMETDAIKLIWMAHFMLGGVRINERAETSVKGIFAAGEVAGGITGLKRLPGTGIAEGIVFGEIAGQHAATHAKTRTAPHLEEAVIRSSIGHLREMPEKVLRDLEECKAGISVVLYKMLRDEKNDLLKSLHDDIVLRINDVHRVLGAHHKDFWPVPSQSRSILALKSLLSFCSLYVAARMADHATAKYLNEDSRRSL